MGCCASRPDSDGPGPGPSDAIRASSSRNITAPSTRPASRASLDNVQASGSRQNGAIDRPNTPLKPIPVYQRSKLPNTMASPTATVKGRGRGHVGTRTDSMGFLWTRERLEKERGDWWDTQVTGSQEVWGAIRLAAQCLQAGQLQEAQSWLEATDCTCPTGCLWKGVYDSTGVMYKVPEWLVVEPDGLVEESDSELEAAAGTTSATPGLDGAQNLDDDEADTVLVRARISRTQRDVRIRIRRKEPVASVIEKIKKQAQLDFGTKIRLAYGGRLYLDHERLESHQYWNFANEYVLTALVVD